MKFRPKMLRLLIWRLLICWTALPAIMLPLHAADGPKGTLVIVGGGKTPAGLHRRLVELAGGPQARVLVIGQASEGAEAGDGSARAFTSAGAASVANLKSSDPAAALAAVQAADVIWFGGGQQTRLMEELRRLQLVDAVRERFQRGAVIGGTSAGAAVMSKLMIAGPSPLAGGLPALSEGLGLWSEAVVDQHFLARKREPRLLATVRAHPHLLGVGIDESTYVVVSGGSAEVGGQGAVVLLDARAGGEPQRREFRAGAQFDSAAVALK